MDLRVPRMRREGGIGNEVPGAFGLRVCVIAFCFLCVCVCVCVCVCGVCATELIKASVIGKNLTGRAVRL